MAEDTTEYIVAPVEATRPSDHNADLYQPPPLIDEVLGPWVCVLAQGVWPPHLLCKVWAVCVLHVQYMYM